MRLTTLLSPESAVQVVWAMTGAYAKEDSSKLISKEAEADLKQIKEQADKNNSAEEKQYMTAVMAAIDASRRSIEIVYKGRELNFEENEKLRDTYLESVKESLEFGKNAKDFFKSLPTMTIGAAGGVTVAEALGVEGVQLWAIGLLLAGVGYFVRLARKRRQYLYIKQDYERNLYYCQYISRVKMILTTLYQDLNRIHKRIFGDNYSNLTGDEIYTSLLSGVDSKPCPYVHKHWKQKVINPDIWTFCESGVDEAVKSCPFWKNN